MFFTPEMNFACFASLREERKTGSLSGKGMNESFKDEEENIVRVGKISFRELRITKRNMHG
jgi:hypothetical protein